jgi:membrane-bound inhibitor of C-type lysozyme
MGASTTEVLEMKAAFLIIAPAVLAGCATTAGDATERRVVYACNYGANLTVTYAPSVARIESEAGTVTLRQRPSAPGFWYESGTHTLSGSGDEIIYKVGHMAPKQCRAT